MSPIDIGAVIVALVAAFGAWAAQRAAAKASKFNTLTGGRLDAEQGAYERARAFDLVTIERQDAEIKDLREANESLRRELVEVKQRLAQLEHLSKELERFHNEHPERGTDQE